MCLQLEYLKAWADEVVAVQQATIDAQATEIQRLRDVLQWTHEAYCTPAWTDRDLHAPECLLDEKEAPDA